MRYVERRYKCGDCGECHADEDYARMCCLPTVREVWMCPVCDDYHYEESEALACCPDPEDEEPVPLSSAELEALGQRRLVGL